MNPNSPNLASQVANDQHIEAGSAVEEQEKLPVQAKSDFVTCLRRRFNKDQIAEITDAAEFAAEAHFGQLRKDGSPYITHPLKVAEIASDWHLDKHAVIAALLHDVVEDTEVEIDEIEDKFGADISALVNGLSKIEQIEQLEHQYQDENPTIEQLAILKSSASFRKLLLAVARDWRVIVIKIADRLHNMRTLNNIKSRTKQRRISQETLDIYVPIALRLGFMEVYSELQTLAFSYTHPLRYQVLSAAIQRSRNRMRTTIPKIKRAITNAMKTTGVKVTSMNREKNVYSVYCKMIEKKLSFSEVDDILGFRLIVDNRLDCYVTLGVVHELFRPVPEKLKDYISQPKANGYQSIHTTVLTNTGNVVEMQIRTWEMHSYAEYGLAAHAGYKELAKLPEQARAKTKVQSHTNQLLNNLLALSSQITDSGEFLTHMRLDLFPNEVVVLTPRGKVIELVKGATALDMAYYVHTDLGDKAKHAIINGSELPISTKLESGDIVEIVTSKEIEPNPQWLNFVFSSKARSHIRAKLKQHYSDEMAQLGRDLLKSALGKIGFDIDDLEDQTVKKFAISNFGTQTKEELYTEIALGKLSAQIIANEIIGPHKHNQQKQKEISISIMGDRHAGISRARCCEPLPPEKIIGIMQKNFGLIVHRANCPEVANQVANKNFFSLHWDETTAEQNYKVSLALSCNNRQGLLADVLAKFPSESVNIVSINLGGAEEFNPVANISLEVEVKDATQIERLFRRINETKGVSITRAGAAAHN